MITGFLLGLMLAGAMIIGWRICQKNKKVIVVTSTPQYWSRIKQFPAVNANHMAGIVGFFGVIIGYFWACIRASVEPSAAGMGIMCGMVVAFAGVAAYQYGTKRKTDKEYMRQKALIPVPPVEPPPAEKPPAQTPISIVQQNAAGAPA